MIVLDETILMPGEPVYDEHLQTTSRFSYDIVRTNPTHHAFMGLDLGFIAS